MYWQEMSYYKLIPKTNQQRLRDEHEPDCGEEEDRDEYTEFYESMSCDEPKGDN